MGDLGKLIVTKGLKKCPKSKKSQNLVTPPPRHIAEYCLNYNEQHNIFRSRSGFKTGEWSTNVSTRTESCPRRRGRSGSGSFSDLQRPRFVSRSSLTTIFRHLATSSRLATKSWWWTTKKAGEGRLSLQRRRKNLRNPDPDLTSSRCSRISRMPISFPPLTQGTNAAKRFCPNWCCSSKFMEDLRP